MIPRMLCVLISVMLVVWFLLPRVAGLMVDTVGGGFARWGGVCDVRGGVGADRLGGGGMGLGAAGRSAIAGGAAGGRRRGHGAPGAAQGRPRHVHPENRL